MKDENGPQGTLNREEKIRLAKNSLRVAREIKGFVPQAPDSGVFFTVLRLVSEVLRNLSECEVKLEEIGTTEVELKSIAVDQLKVKMTPEQGNNLWIFIRNGVDPKEAMALAFRPDAEPPITP